jgi:hypothetical protein
MRITTVVVRPGSSDDLASRRYKACIDETRDHGAIEPIGEHECVLCDAVRNTGQ